MQRILNQSHSKETLIYSLSKMFESASYYGFRALLVLYMIVGDLKIDDTKAIYIYGLFTGSIIFSKIIGAFLGDLILGNKKALIIGGIIQTLGTLSLIISSTNGLYVGLVLIIIGSGLYSPNITSHFGKLYLNNSKLLDSAFTIYYIATNIGSFVGVLLIGYIGERFGWSYGFTIASLLMMFSFLFPLILKETKIIITKGKSVSINKRIVIIGVTFVLIALFWSIYEISNIRTLDLQMQFSELTILDIPKSIWVSMNSIFILPIGIFAAIIWAFFYNNQFIKLTLGFLFGSISFGILFLIPEFASEKHLIIYLISLFFINISEIFIAPIINSILTRFTNPKYLAIIISLVFIPIRVFSLSIGLFSDSLYDNPLLSLKFAFFAMSFVSVGLLIYILVNKKSLSLLSQ